MNFSLPKYILICGLLNLTNSVSAMTNNGIDITLDGFLNQAYFSVDDGVQNTWFVGNNDNDDTTLHLVGTIPVNREVKLQGVLLGAIKNHSSDTYNQVNQDTTNLLHFRAYELKWLMQRYGTIYFGYGESASDNSAEVDFTPVFFVQYSEVFDVGFSFFFRNPNGTLSNISVGDSFNNYDGLDRVRRIRYDTPTFYHSYLAASYVEGGKKDIAWFYERDFGQFKFGAAAALARSYSTVPKVAENILDGSFCITHYSGINVTGSAGKKFTRIDGALDPHSHYLKLGYVHKLWHCGETAISTDIGKYYHESTNDAKATAYGAAIVQYIDPWKTQFYIAWRQFKLRHGDTRFNNINIVFTGVRINFDGGPHKKS